MTTLLTENIEALIPDLPSIRQGLTDVKQESKSSANGGSKAFAMAKENQDQIEELKGEFEYMKTRFSPQFLQRVDKSIS